jgi:hypothetical protein
MGGELVITKHSVICLAITVVVLGALFLLLKYSKWGLAVRCTASNEFTAELMGINTHVITAVSWAIAGALGVLAAVMYAGGGTKIGPAFMTTIQVNAFLAGILGGSGMALLAAGLPGLIAGFIAGLLAGIVSTETAERMIRKAELPAPIRRRFTEKLFRRGLNGRKEQIREKVLEQMLSKLALPSESALETVKTIAESIEHQLEQMMKRAALLIH